jgi:septal ring factor EnvC (AmiA/AmiB activator)
MEASLISLIMGGGPMAVVSAAVFFLVYAMKQNAKSQTEQMLKLGAGQQKIADQLQTVIQKSIREIEEVRGDVKSLKTETAGQQRELDRHDRDIERLQAQPTAH